MFSGREGQPETPLWYIRNAVETGSRSIDAMRRSIRDGAPAETVDSWRQFAVDDLESARIHLGGVDASEVASACTMIDALAQAVANATR